MYDPAYDIDVLAAMLDEFEDFVRSDVVFWPLAGSTRLIAPFPKLTVGGLLFYHFRLAALQEGLAVEAVQTALPLLATADAALRNWRANLERKALAEIGARLNSWAWFLDDCDDRPASCDRNYPGEAQARVYAQLLLDLLTENAQAAPSQTRLRSLDSRLRGRFVPGKFIWEDDLRLAFPKDKFWFLYGRPAD